MTALAITAAVVLLVLRAVVALDQADEKPASCYQENPVRFHWSRPNH